eukprot:Amastigsp_a174631_13.p2 type:complete len:282 gc:universal Amastigsp_a174631_13:176-1021(+)
MRVGGSERCVLGGSWLVIFESQRECTSTGLCCAHNCAVFGWVRGVHKVEEPLDAIRHGLVVALDCSRLDGLDDGRRRRINVDRDNGDNLFSDTLNFGKPPLVAESPGALCARHDDRVVRAIVCESRDLQSLVVDERRQTVRNTLDETRHGIFVVDDGKIHSVQAVNRVPDLLRVEVLGLFHVGVVLPPRRVAIEHEECVPLLDLRGFDKAIDVNVDRESALETSPDGFSCSRGGEIRRLEAFPRSNTRGAELARLARHNGCEQKQICMPVVDQSKSRGHKR